MQKSLCKVKDAYKLKYVVVPREDLIQIYILYIRSLLVYCSTLTTEQSNKLERVQKLCLKIILGDCYDGYENALEACGLENKLKGGNQKLASSHSFQHVSSEPAGALKPL